MKRESDPRSGAPRLDHVGIAVENLEQSLTFWRDAMGLDAVETEEVPGDGVRVAFLRTGECSTELLEPTSADTPVGRFLASGRKGIHHIAYRVENIEETLAQLRAADVPLIHEKPREGSRGTRIAFLHPRGTQGVLVELVEYPDATGKETP